jgi:hypothetical protein
MKYAYRIIIRITQGRKSLEIHKNGWKSYVNVELRNLRYGGVYRIHISLNVFIFWTRDSWRDHIFIHQRLSSKYEINIFHL